MGIYPVNTVWQDRGDGVEHGRGVEIYPVNAVWQNRGDGVEHGQPPLVRTHR